MPLPSSNPRRSQRPRPSNLSSFPPENSISRTPSRASCSPGPGTSTCAGSPTSSSSRTVSHFWLRPRFSRSLSRCLVTLPLALFPPRPLALPAPRPLPPLTLSPPSPSPGPPRPTLPDDDRDPRPEARGHLPPVHPLPQGHRRRPHHAEGRERGPPPRRGALGGRARPFGDPVVRRPVLGRGGLCVPEGQDAVWRGPAPARGRCRRGGGRRAVRGREWELGGGRGPGRVLLLLLLLYPLLRFLAFPSLSFRFKASS